MPGLVPHIAQWQRAHRGLPATPVTAGSDTAAPFPQSPLPVAVDLFMFGNWVEVTRLPNQQAGVYARDRVTVARGRPSEAGLADPTAINFTLNNRDGRFSPRNPAGPYYGQIGRNTPARVRVGADPRGAGEIVAWPQRWDSTGRDVWVPVQAAGILRRLQQGVAPLRSVQYRAVNAQTTAPVAYWPAEDADGSTSIASGVGGPPMTLIGAPTFASSTVFPGADALPVVASSRWRGAIPAYTPTGSTQVRWLWAVPAGGTTDLAGVGRVVATGTAARWDLNYSTTAAGTVTLSAFDGAGANLMTSAGIAGVNGGAYRVSIELVQAGADIDWALRLYTAAGVTSRTGTLASRTTGISTLIYLDTYQNMPDDVFGHVAVAAAVGPGAATSDEVAAYAGETAAGRLTRLCAEENVYIAVVGDPAVSAAMGPQRPGKLVDLLRECEDADQGILYEPRDRVGLAYRVRESLYNQDPTLTLDYPSADLSTLEPTDDDQLTRNDVTVTRVGGSSSRQQLQVGALSVQDPPAGVGRYDTTVTVNVATDAALPGHAGWRLAVGTVDEPRYPQVGLHLSRDRFPGARAWRTAAAARLDVGDVLTVTGPLAQVQAGDIEQVAAGSVEVLTAFERTLTVNCVPYTPYRVGVADSGGAPSVGADGSFEAGTNAAGVSGFFGGPAPVVAQSTLHPTEQAHSLEITWAAGGQGLVAFGCSGLTVGRTYTVWCDAYVPSGSPDVQLAVAGNPAGFGDLRAEKDEAFVLSVTWAAMTAADQLQVICQVPAGAGTVCYLDALGIVDTDDVTSRYSPDEPSLTSAGCTLAAAAAAADTALSVAAAAGPAWTTNFAEYPFYLIAGGERVAARYATGAASPQTITVARGVDTTPAALPAGAAVGLWRPATFAL